jgi:hypothetical protein
MFSITSAAASTTNNVGLLVFTGDLRSALFRRALSDSHRDYRQSIVSGFGQDYFRVSSRLTLNVGLRYDFYSNPTETHGRLSVIRNPATDSGPTVGQLFAATPRDLVSPQAGFAWNIFGDGKTVLRGGAGIFRDQLPIILYGVDRFLPPFENINSYVFPSFLNPQSALLTQPLYVLQATYHPKFPYALQYNLNLEREIRRVLFSRRGILVREGITSFAKWNRTLSNQP